VNEGRVAVGKREFSIGKIQIQLLLNLLGQVPLIRKVSNSKFSFEVHFSKERNFKGKKKKILENDFQKKFEQKRDIECLAFFWDCLRKEKGRLIPHFFPKEELKSWQISLP
jgi:hypothetical protein